MELNEIPDYPDAGAGAFIARGDASSSLLSLDGPPSDIWYELQIKIKPSVNVSGYTADGLLFSDGTTLPADVVLLATGYNKDVRGNLAPIVGDDIAYSLQPIWNLTKEGEVRGIWQPTTHPALWIQGGDTCVAFSLVLLGVRT